MKHKQQLMKGDEMKKIVTKLGVVFAFVLLASSMQANAAQVYFQNNGVFKAYFQIKLPNEKKFIESERDHSYDLTKRNESLPIGSLVCVSVLTLNWDFKPVYLNSYFLVQGEHTTFLNFDGDLGVRGVHYTFGGVNNAKLSEPIQREESSICSSSPW